MQPCRRDTDYFSGTLDDRRDAVRWLRRQKETASLHFGSNQEKKARQEPAVPVRQGALSDLTRSCGTGRGKPGLPQQLSPTPLPFSACSLITRLPTSSCAYSSVQLRLNWPDTSASIAP